MDKMMNRIRQMLYEIESEYSGLVVREISTGYEVRYFDWIGNLQIIYITRWEGKRTSYTVRWMTNGNQKLRLPAYDRHFLG